MRLSTHRKSQVVGYSDQITGLILRIGAPLLILSSAFLLTASFGNGIRGMGQLSHAERVNFINYLNLVNQCLVYSGAAVVLALIVRLSREEILGQALSLLGATFYFGSPAAFGMIAEYRVLAANVYILSVITAFRTLGLVCLIPGLILVLRDAAVRIWTGVSVKRVLERRWGDEEERLKKNLKNSLYGCCWDLPFCRDFVRKVCPAYSSKKSCWRVKVGCYCDEKTILRAMMSSGEDNEHVQGIMNSLGLNKSDTKSSLSKRLKRERCRRCMIYAEHQRQKYRILSPAVFPAVGLILFACYGTVSACIGNALTRTDKVISFLMYRHTAGTSVEQQHAMTVMAIAWLVIVAISYTLKAIEYFVFELQV